MAFARRKALVRRLIVVWMEVFWMDIFWMEGLRNWPRALDFTPLWNLPRK